MLKTRIITAAILLPTFLAALLYFQPIFWAILLLALTVIGAREWCKLADFSVRNAIIFMLLTALMGGELLFLLSESITGDHYTPLFTIIYSLSFVFWVLVAPLLLRLTKPIKTPIILMVLGWLILLPTCLALYQLREISPKMLLGIMATVWIADSAAYFLDALLENTNSRLLLAPAKHGKALLVRY